MYNFFFIDNITYRDLFDALRNFQPHLKPCSSDARLFLYSYIGQKINFSIDEKYEIILNNKILRFVTTLNRKWVAVNRTATTFMTKNEEWLNTKFVLSQNENEPVDCRGRPSKSFSDLSERSKTRKVKSLVETTSIIKSPIVKLTTSVKKLIIRNDEETDEDSQIHSDNIESDSE